jgi:hypothetical protein
MVVPPRSLNLIERALFAFEIRFDCLCVFVFVICDGGVLGVRCSCSFSFCLAGAGISDLLSALGVAVVCDV